MASSLFGNVPASATAGTPAPAGIVLTGQQDARAAGQGAGKYWEEKPNSGYSGTPLWKLHLERDMARDAAAAMETVKIPDGFKKHKDEWYWSEKRQNFWNVKDGKFYVWDPTVDKPVELYDAKNFEIVTSAGYICHEKAAQVRHVTVKELNRAATALRISIGHLDLPCAMYCLYEGHRGGTSGNVCTDFCAKHLHGKLLPKLAGFRGYWEDSRLEAAMRESFEELDADFAEKHPDSKEGCSAAVALVTGHRLVVASLGDISCVLCNRSGEVTRLVQAHALPDPDLSEGEDSETEEQVAAAAEAAARPLRWTRSFGDLDFKSPGKEVPQLLRTPEVKVIHLEHKHHGFAFICRSLYAAIGGSPAVTTVFRRSAGRPRFASGTLVDAAVQWLGQVEASCGLASVVAFFDKIEAKDTPPAKKARTVETSQIRCRHILLKHKECKSVIDKVRNKQVKRTRGEAERLLRAVIEQCEVDKGQKAFTTRVRELSECQSSLKAGDHAGDLGWVKRGTSKLGDVFEAAAFALQCNQLSDLVDTDQGIHIILRTA